MKRLAIVLDEIAVLRNLRKGFHPDPAQIVGFLEMSGVDGITIHLREDDQFVRKNDVRILRYVKKTHLNLRIAPKASLVRFAMEVKPDMITFVDPSAVDSSIKSRKLTKNDEKLATFVEEIRKANIIANVLIEPDPEQLKLASKLKFDAVGLNTESFSRAPDLNSATVELEKIRSVAIEASKNGLYVLAGGSLNYHNIRQIAAIKQIDEINVGHAVMARALFLGIQQALRDLIALVR